MCSMWSLLRSRLSSLLEGSVAILNSRLCRVVQTSRLLSFCNSMQFVSNMYHHSQPHCSPLSPPDLSCSFTAIFIVLCIFALCVHIMNNTYISCTCHVCWVGCTVNVPCLCLISLLCAMYPNVVVESAYVNYAICLILTYLMYIWCAQYVHSGETTVNLMYVHYMCSTQVVLIFYLTLRLLYYGCRGDVLWM